MANKQTNKKVTAKPAEEKSVKKVVKKPVIKDERQVKKIRSFSKVGFITGIISCASCITGAIGLVTGILAIVFSALSKNKNINDEKASNRSKKGFVMGIVGTAVSAVMIVAWTIFLSWFMWKFIIW